MGEKNSQQPIPMLNFSLGGLMKSHKHQTQNSFATSWKMKMIQTFTGKKV